MYAGVAAREAKHLRCITGESLRRVKEVLLTLFELAAYGSGLLLLPCAVAGLFGCALSYILILIILGAATGTLILTGLAMHEGWYFDHLSGEDTRERAKPSPARRTISGIVQKVVRHQKAAHDQRVAAEGQEERRPDESMVVLMETGIQAVRQRSP